MFREISRSPRAGHRGIQLASQWDGRIPLKTLQFTRICPTQACTKPLKRSRSCFVRLVAPRGRARARPGGPGRAAARAGLSRARATAPAGGARTCASPSCVDLGPAHNPLVLRPKTASHHARTIIRGWEQGKTRDHRPFSNYPRRRLWAASGRGGRRRRPAARRRRAGAALR